NGAEAAGASSARRGCRSTRTWHLVSRSRGALQNSKGCGVLPDGVREERAPRSVHRRATEREIQIVAPLARRVSHPSLAPHWPRQNVRFGPGAVILPVT